MNAEVRIVLALGSNLGDRLGFLRGGLEALRPQIRRIRASPVYASDPEGPVEQPEFLNAAVVATTLLGPGDLLDRLHDVEALAGRVRDVPNGPRTLDLDLIFFGDLVVESPRLRVPHPRWLNRAFVRVPILDVAAEFEDPVTGRTVADLSAGRSVLGVRPFAPAQSLESTR